MDEGGGEGVGGRFQFCKKINEKLFLTVMVLAIASVHTGSPVSPPVHQSQKNREKSETQTRGHSRSMSFLCFITED